MQLVSPPCTTLNRPCFRRELGHWQDYRAPVVPGATLPRGLQRWSDPQRRGARHMRHRSDTSRLWCASSVHGWFRPRGSTLQPATKPVSCPPRGRHRRTQSCLLVLLQGSIRAPCRGVHAGGEDHKHPVSEFVLDVEFPGVAFVWTQIPGNAEGGRESPIAEPVVYATLLSSTMRRRTTTFRLGVKRRG